MLAIPTRAQATLGHRAFFVDVCATGDVLAASPEGECTVLGPDLSVRARFTCAPKPTSMALAVQHNRIAVCSALGLSVRDLEGRETYALPVELGAECRFAPEHDLLWTIHPVDPRAFELALRDASNGRVQHRQRVRSPHKNARSMLLAHPSSTAITIWIAAGQDGQWLFWGRDDGTEIVVRRLRDVDECTPPAFDPSGRAFLLVERPTLLTRWKANGTSRTVLLTAAPGKEAGDVFAESLAWLSPTRAVVASNNGRLWLVDPSAGRVIGEAYVEGHAPDPIGSIWPSLPEMTGTASNLSFFTGGQGGIVSAHHVPTRAGGHMQTVHLAAWDLGWDRSVKPALTVSSRVGGE
jgi:hypothetical protein